MSRIVFFFVILMSSNLLYAHEIQTITQHLAIKKQKISGWQQDILARATISRKFEAGVQATYLDRFNISDRRAGAFVGFHPTDKWFLELKYLQGMGNQILPEKQTQLQTYYTIGPGYSAFATLRNSRYAFTNLNTLNLGLEIEKIPSLIFIPQVMIGNAVFKAPSETKTVHNYGLRVVFYRERNFSLYAFGFKGKETAQGINGVSNLLISTTTGGGGAGYYFTPNFRGELNIDHTDYREINNQFLTTSLLLNYYF